MQEHGLDYFDTYNPVIKPTTIRVILTIALSKGWPLRQLDVNNAFLHGDIQGNVYMQQAPGFEDPSHPHLVCHLKKALYGLKQAPRAWFHRLKVFLLDHKFTCSSSDNSLFIIKTANNVLSWCMLMTLSSPK
jgi:Reverse transcriptase (RNA-dependent DNA polymerase)